MKFIAIDTLIPSRLLSGVTLCFSQLGKSINMEFSGTIADIFVFKEFTSVFGGSYIRSDIGEWNKSFPAPSGA